MADLIVNKPWGFEYSVFKDGISLRMLHIKAGEETSLHCHMKKDVLIILLKGRARMIRTGNSTDYMEDVELKPMFVRQIPKEIFHKTKAIEDAIVLEIESSGDVHDLVRAADKYGRKQGYEVKEIVSIDEQIDIIDNIIKGVIK
jgi:mannose-6-phosphate isomerase-like protein (cupin superfamily)